MNSSGEVRVADVTEQAAQLVPGERHLDRSASNAADVFTGWSDPPLSALGVAQGRDAAVVLRALGVHPTCVHTSLLRRSIATAEIVLDGLGPDEVERLDIPTAVPMRYRLGRDGRAVVEAGGRYLDQVGAAELIRVGSALGRP